MQIGHYTIENQLVLAPMAGVTDRPFRQLCRRLGAGLVVSEMVAANALLFGSEKTLQRIDHQGEPGPRSVQIAGADPQMMAHAAQFNVAQGADIIDINMGCPAKKVCNKAAGSALLRDKGLVSEIISAVVQAVNVPVTLKIRTGWCQQSRNASEIAGVAEEHGIKALSVHGRTRADGYSGEAEYDTIKQLKQQLSIPVIANGDINSPEQARKVLDYTSADAVMIGRAAQGNPWIFREINHYLQTGCLLAAPSEQEVCDVLLEHLTNLYQFYGEYRGVRIARKHIGWYCKKRRGSASFRDSVMHLESATEQTIAVKSFFKYTDTLKAA